MSSDTSPHRLLTLPSRMPSRPFSPPPREPAQAGNSQPTLILDDGAGGTSNFTCPEGVICGGLTGSTSTTSTDPAGGLNMGMRCSDPAVTTLEGDGIGQE